MNDEQVLATFGQRIRALRKARGLSQEGLGFDAHLDQTYISDVELGKRNVSLLNIHGLAQALGVTKAQLFEGLDEPEDKAQAD